MKFDKKLQKLLKVLDFKLFLNIFQFVVKVIKSIVNIVEIPSRKMKIAENIVL